MLVTFSCSSYADITMFGDVAIRLLTLMGHSGTVPGAILAEDVPEALERLQAAMRSEQTISPGHTTSGNEADDETVVTLSHRAMPLIELLEAAVKAKCNVMWDRYS